MSDLSVAIAGLSAVDREGFNDFCHQCEEVAALHGLATVFQWLADGATGASPTTGLPNAELNVFGRFVLVHRRLPTSWADAPFGAREERLGAMAEPPEWSEPVRDVWNLLLIELQQARESRDVVGEPGS